jgi:hypothetical protein
LRTLSQESRYNNINKLNDGPVRKGLELSHRWIFRLYCGTKVIRTRSGITGKKRENLGNLGKKQIVQREMQHEKSRGCYESLLLEYPRTESYFLVMPHYQFAAGSGK